MVCYKLQICTMATTSASCDSNLENCTSHSNENWMKWMNKSDAKCYISLSIWFYFVKQKKMNVKHGAARRKTEFRISLPHSFRSFVRSSPLVGCVCNCVLNNIIYMRIPVHLETKCSMVKSHTHTKYKKGHISSAYLTRTKHFHWLVVVSLYHCIRTIVRVCHTSATERFVFIVI